MKRIGSKKTVRDALFVLIPVIAIALMVLFMSVINDINTGRDEQAVDNLERSLKKAAAACYAAEGIYPPNVKYIEDHYGIQVDDERFWVDYKAFASNIMPEITVLRKEDQ